MTLVYQLQRKAKGIWEQLIGAETFKEKYVREKVATWVQEVNCLVQIAESQPHAAYAAFTHGLASKWTFLARTVPDVSHLFQPLEDAIRQRFLPTLTGQNHFNDSVRSLIALPTCLGGLGITNPVTEAAKQHDISHKVTAPQVNLIVEQSMELPTKTLEEQLQAKKMHIIFNVKHWPLLSIVRSLPYRFPSRRL